MAVLVLCYVAACFTAGLAIISAILTKAHLVTSHAQHAVSVAFTVSLVLIALHADKLARHRFTLTRSRGNEKRTDLLPEQEKEDNSKCTYPALFSIFFISFNNAVSTFPERRSPRATRLT